MADDKKDNDIFNLAQYYRELGNLFTGNGPVFTRKIAAKLASPNNNISGVPVGTARAFLKDANNMYTSMMQSYGQYSRNARYSSYCFSKDTLVWTIEHGAVSFEKLVEMYPKQDEIFHVYSYDHENEKVVINEARAPRKTKVDKLFRVHLVGGGYVDASADHRFLLKDGTYKELKDLSVGESLMPLYRAKFASSKDYVFVNTLKNNDVGRRYAAEHVYAMEYFNGGKLDGPWNNKEKQVVHHINHQADDNKLSNLVVMSESDHKKYHAEITKKNNVVKWKSESFRDSFSKSHSEFMKKNNPASRKDITILKIAKFVHGLESDVVLFSDVKKHFDCGDTVILNRIRTARIS